jgi:phosphatidylinositol kinase/protein kinase (PI-3  family)
MTHPHAVLFSLLVPLSLSKTEREENAREILSKLRASHSTTVSSVLRLAAEFERASVSWWESAMSDIEEASRADVNRNDMDEMLSILSSVSQITKSQPSTFSETSFVRAYGRDLELAETWWHLYKKKRDPASLQTLWHYYTTVFYSVKQPAKELKIIDLADASPYLAALRDSDIPVPGTHGTGKPVIPIGRWFRR